MGYLWNDPGTEVEDELPTSAASPGRYAPPPLLNGTSAVQESFRETFDLDLAKVLLDVSVMPTMISPIQDPVEPNRSVIADYTAPAIPVMGAVSEPAMVTPPRAKGGARGLYPRFSPISEASSLVRDVRPTSSLLPSPQLSPTGVSPVTGVTEATLDASLPIVASPREDSPRSPERECTPVQPHTQRHSLWGRPRCRLPWGFRPI